MANRAMQHYVPRFFLKNFSRDEKSISLYRPENGLYVRRSPIRSTACRKHFYTTGEGTEFALGQYEDAAAPVIRKILQTGDLPCDFVSWHALLSFIAAQDIRSPKCMAYMERFYVEELAQWVRAYNHEGIETGLTPEKVRKEVGVRNYLANFLPTTSLIADLLSDLIPFLVVNKSSIPFVTSDQTVICCNPLFNGVGYRFGYGQVGVIVAFPISPTMCIVLADMGAYSTDGKSQKIVFEGKRTARRINSLMASNCYEEIYLPPDCEESFARSVGEAWDFGSDDSVKVLESGASSLLILEHPSPVSVDDFPFFKKGHRFAQSPVPFRAMADWAKRKSDFESELQKERVALLDELSGGCWDELSIEEKLEVNRTAAVEEFDRRYIELLQDYMAENPSPGWLWDLA